MKLEKKSLKKPSSTSAKSAPKKRPARKSVEIPPILLQGDHPAAAPVRGPGQRYALGPTAPDEKLPVGEPGELPEAYGTQRLLLTARDPHWLYAHWDLTQEQLRKYNSLSTDRHLVLKIYLNHAKGEPVAQIHVHPESRNWFVHVDRAGAKYLAELGYFDRSNQWHRISVSAATLTPPDQLSDDTTARFATIPTDLSFEELLAMIRSMVRDNVPLAEALQQLRASGYKDLPDAEAIATARWTPAQEKALAEVIGMDRVRRVWMGSLEITELIRRQLMRDMSSAALGQFSLPSSWSGAVSSFSSPFGGQERKKSFWFNVNAELIIYGATEPDATVTIGGRTIKLRADGTFSYRFALPDGKYDLPAVATSADQTDSRSADLKFSRKTHYAGEVGMHPQDPALRAPRVENVA